MLTNTLLLSFNVLYYITLIFLSSYSFIPLFSVGEVWGVIIRLNKSGGGASVASLTRYTQPSWSMGLFGRGP